MDYETDELNQYDRMVKNGGAAFVPQNDADGNQTLVKTSTGIWKVTYNAENRPVKFESEDGGTIVECAYDSMGRRFEKKVTVGGTTGFHARYLYRGYLQVAEVDLTGETPELVRSYIWDPAEPVATRVLAMTLWKAKGMEVEEHLYYMHDALKNVTAIFGEAGGRRALYEYRPYGGLITSEGNMAGENKFRFSSEYMDDELGLVYYNYRHLNPLDGRWINRDPIAEQGGWNLYGFVKNNGISNSDFLGYEILIAEDMQGSIGGVGLGYEVYIKGKTLVKIDGQNFYMEYSRKASPGHTKTPPGKLWMYNKNNKAQMYRLDAPHGKLGWHHNVSTPISKVKGFNIVDHSERGAWAFKQTITIFKWGGRALFFVGGAVSLYQIYHAEDRVREVIRQVSGWAGAAAGSLAGGKVGAMAGGALGSVGAGVGSAPGAVVGAGVGALIGGVTGWLVGTSIAERVYDWIFTELEKEEYEVVCAKN